MYQDHVPDAFVFSYFEESSSRKFLEIIHTLTRYGHLTDQKYWRS